MIERLESRGQPGRAERATAMTNVPASRSAGAIAALQARNDVSVVFVAHVVLEDLHSLGRIWRKIPLRRHVAGTYWSIPPHEAPTDPAEIGAWLFDQWEQVDQWIADHRAEAFGVEADRPSPQHLRAGRGTTPRVDRPPLEYGGR